jgi:hypothetical protein
LKEYGDQEKVAEIKRYATEFGLKGYYVNNPNFVSNGKNTMSIKMNSPCAPTGANFIKPGKFEGWSDTSGYEDYARNPS